VESGYSGVDSEAEDDEVLHDETKIRQLVNWDLRGILGRTSWSVISVNWSDFERFMATFALAKSKAIRTWRRGVGTKPDATVQKKRCPRNELPA